MNIEELMDLLNAMIDDRCDMFGIKNTIAYLKDYGLSKDDLVALGFDEAMVQEVFDEDEAAE